MAFSGLGWAAFSLILRGMTSASRPGPHPDWLRPQWPVPATVHALCTTRAGGQSVPPYDSLNLGDHVGDDVLTVGRNRARLAQTLQAHPVFMQQVHGNKVLRLDRFTSQGNEADACWTQERGVVCTVLIADCLPVLLTDKQGRFVAAAHAGWRGLSGEGGDGVLEILERAVLTQLRTQGQRLLPSDLLAWLGPCIGPMAYEVGPDVRSAFEAWDRQAASLFRPIPGKSGKWLADLPGLARQRLHALGVQQIYGNNGSDAWCTVTQRSRFFSHRRDRVSGRMAACIWLG
jgi:YfiH family protein